MCETLDTWILDILVYNLNILMEIIKYDCKSSKRIDKTGGCNLSTLLNKSLTIFNKNNDSIFVESLDPHKIVSKIWNMKYICFGDRLW